MIKQSLKKGLFTLLIIIMVFSSSCKGGGTRTVDSSTYHPNLPEPFDMGIVQFEVDPTHSASLDYTVDNNEEQVLQVTDASGITWTLTLPVGALDYDQTITMTAMSKLTSTDIPGELIGGVVLEPDGLTFVNPPTITLSGTGEEAVILLFTGKQDGTGNEFALNKLGDPQTSATLYHFSTFWGNQVAKAKAGGDTAWANYAAKMGKELDELIAMAKALLRYDLEVSVPPPAVEFSCKDDQGKKNDDQKIQEHIDQFIDPEAYFIKELSSKVQFQGAVSGHWEWNKFSGKMEWVTSQDERIMPLMTQLADRIAAKFDMIIKLYPEAKYFPAMVKLLLQIQKSVELVGGDQAPFTKYYDLLAKTITKVYETLFDKLVNRHDYSAAKDIFDIYRMTQLLGLDNGVDILGNLEKALTFEMTGNYTWHAAKESWELKSKFKVYYSWGEDMIKGSGSGTIMYSYDPDPNDTVRDPGGFSVEATIKNLDFCNQTAELLVTPYAAYEDVFSFPGDDLPKQTMPLSMTSWKVGYMDNMKSGLYSFPLNFFNLDSSPVNDNFETKPPVGSPISGVFTITIEHTPQKIE